VTTPASGVLRTSLPQIAHCESDGVRLRPLGTSRGRAVPVAEWPAMSRREVTLIATPAALARVLQLTLSLRPRGEGQRIA
jgi:hypothetical protein